MPRIPRGCIPDDIVHVLNRSNDRAAVFRTPAEYSDFIQGLYEARERFEVRFYAFCLMPNHFHFVAKNVESGSLSTFMQWLMTRHVRRHHKRCGTSGHIWQGRFKSFPVQEDEHLLTVLRYVLLNPVRAHLVDSADQWRWSSLNHSRLVDPWPVALPTHLETWLADPLPEPELEAVRNSVRRRAPFGSPIWQALTAKANGLESTLRSVGRPSDADLFVRELFARSPSSAEGCAVS